MFVLLLSKGPPPHQGKENMSDQKVQGSYDSIPTCSWNTEQDHKKQNDKEKIQSLKQYIVGDQNMRAVGGEMTNGKDVGSRVTVKTQAASAECTVENTGVA